MAFLTRLHEWAADRFSFIQYPNVRRDFSVGGTPPRSNFLKPHIPWEMSVFLVVTSTLTIVVCAGMLAYLAFIAYLLLS